MNRPVLLVILALSGSAFACGSGHTTPLNAAPNAPAAVGDVKVARGDNGNTELRVQVEHLAPPQNMSSGASVYVVWAQPHSQEPAQNLGALVVDSDRKGKLETKTPLKSFDVLVTPEPSATTLSPSGEPVMKATVATE